MDVLKEIESVKSKIKYYKSKNFTVGLVPTMGALHEGHLALIKKSAEENKITCCSIYVNPTQFNNPDDLKKYPKTLDRDLELLAQSGCDLVFTPTNEEMYPELPSLKFHFGLLENVMEGKFRPGHFNGVGIVVSKLFNIIQPDNAYFGQKDLQQFLIIKQMVNDLTYNIKIKSVPVQREADGLAMSSRNRRLSPAARALAPKLFEALTIAKKCLSEKQSISNTKQSISDFFSTNPNILLEYFEIADGRNLQPLSQITAGVPVALCIAAYIEDVRLIDNIIF